MAVTEKKILLVDDEERLLESMSQRILLLGFIPLKASSGMEAIEIAKTTHVDLAIVDLRMPDMEGLVTITKLKEIIPDLRTVLLTGYGNEKVKQATEALGSMYVEKDSMGGLWNIIKQSGDQGKVVVIKPPASTRENRPGQGISGQVEIMTPRQYTETARVGPAGPPPGEAPGPLPKIIGETFEIQRLRKNIQRFAEMDCPIVLKGESGTGKELTARSIHLLSSRRYQRFLAFDCGCFSSNFRFSELVASVEDTGPRLPGEHPDKKPGLFSGTIFLDHIENMPRQNQQEMMDLLKGNKTADGRPMDVRFIVVADQKLEKKIAEGGFRKSLFRRVHAIQIEIPPLRRRMDDLPFLVRHFLDQSNQTLGTDVESVSDEAFRALASHSFPGNVRELRQIIQRAVQLAGKGDITPAHLPDRLQPISGKAHEPDASPFLTIQKMEKQHILKALELTKGNKSKAAELLGISRAALWRKLRAYHQES